MALLLEPTSARAILARALPASSPTVLSIQELPDIYFNAVYILTLSSYPHKAVLKVSPPPEVRVLSIDSSIHLSEAHLLPLLSSSSSSSSSPSSPFSKSQPHIPIPTLLLHDDSCTILDSPYTLLSFLPGHPPKPSSYKAAGRLYRQLTTAIPPPHSKHFGRALPGSPVYPTWRAAFLAQVEAVLRDGEDVLLLLPYAELRRQVVRWAPTLDDIKESKLCVVDFCPADSVLEEGEDGEGEGEDGGEDGGAITGVLDFERAVWGDPELARAFRDAWDGVERGDFVAGYREAGDGKGGGGGGGGDGGVEGRRRKVRGLLYAAYHSAVIIVGTYYYGLNAELEMGERKRLAGVLAELVAFKDE